MEGLFSPLHALRKVMPAETTRNCLITDLRFKGIYIIDGSDTHKDNLLFENEVCNSWHYFFFHDSMRKLTAIFILSMQLFMAACGNNGRSDSHRDSIPAKDTSASTTLPDTMYDNVNQDSIP
jgi:hypothetical protein